MQEEGLVHDVDYDAITYVKPEGTMHFIAGMVDAFPTRQVPSYLVIGLRRGVVVHNYIGMAAKLKGKSLIIAVPNTQVQPTVYDYDEFVQNYNTRTMLWQPGWSNHIVELSIGHTYNVFGLNAVLTEIQMVPTHDEGKVLGRLEFTEVLSNGK